MSINKKGLIFVDQFGFQYDHEDPLLFTDISFKVNDKDALLLLGSSGSGKSTLAFCLNGLYPEAVDGLCQGSISVDGRLVQDFKPGELSQKVGIVFQDPDCQFCMVKVEDEIAFGLENLKIPAEQMDHKITEALGWVGLQSYRNESIYRLSGGMKQKLALACVLSMEPEILILDEPTALLDPVSTREFVKLISILHQKKGLTLIIIEHKLDEWMDLVNRVMILGADGSIQDFVDPHVCFERQEQDLQTQAKGIWTPTVSRMGYRLKEQGIYSGRMHPLTQKELVAGINEEHRLTALTQLQKKPMKNTESSVKSLLYKVKNLSFSHGKRSILKKISCDIYEGEWIAIVGPNGAGKTTLAYHLGGILHSAGQEVLYKDKALGKWHERLLRKEIGFVFQNPEHQFIKDTVFEEVAFGLSLQGLSHSEINMKVEEVLCLFKLNELRLVNPFVLSQGQKRRLSVAVMLVDEQRMLILDEPTYGQDPYTSMQLMNLLSANVKKGRTITMITHDMELVSEYANRVLVLNDGILTFDGSPIELWDNPLLVSESKLLLPTFEAVASKLQTKECNDNVVK